MVIVDVLLLADVRNTVDEGGRTTFMMASKDAELGLGANECPPFDPCGFGDEMRVRSKLSNFWRTRTLLFYDGYTFPSAEHIIHYLKFRYYCGRWETVAHIVPVWCLLCLMCHVMTRHTHTHTHR